MTFFGQIQFGNPKYFKLFQAGMHRIKEDGNTLPALKEDEQRLAEELRNELTLKGVPANAERQG